MSARWLRNRPTRRDDLAAALVSGTLAACVGLATFYLTRLFLARERIGVPVREEREADAPREG